MEPDQERRPRLRGGRSFLQIEDFCRSTGLDLDTVEDLIRTELLEDSLWTEKEPRRPMAIFDDSLPSREALAALGLSVRDDYDPESLRCYELTDDDPDDA